MAAVSRPGVRVPWLASLFRRESLQLKKSRHLFDQLLASAAQRVRGVRPMLDQRRLRHAIQSPLPDCGCHILTQLPDEARDVLMLRFYRDFSLEEMAVSLQPGLSATKMRLYRALDRFALLFQQEMQGAHP